MNLLSLKLDEQLLIVSSLRKGTLVDIYKNWNYSQWFGFGFGFGFGLRLRAVIRRPFYLLVWFGLVKTIVEINI